MIDKRHHAEKTLLSLYGAHERIPTARPPSQEALESRFP